MPINYVLALASKPLIFCLKNTKGIAMNIVSKIISLLLVITLICPLLVEARAGSSYRGSHFGGVRSRSYQPGGYSRPTSSYRSPYAYPPTSPYVRRSNSGSFISGLFSGLLGAYLYNKLFNHETTTNTNQAAVATPSTNGGLWRWLLLLGGAYLLWRFFRRRQRRDSNQSYYGQQPSRLDNPIGVSNAAPLNPASVELGEQDKKSFENLLLQIQNAWSQQDTATLRQLSTPEMYQFFEETIRDNQQRNIANYISGVQLMKLEVLDTWQEHNAKFVKTALTWKAIDYAVNTSLPSNDPGYLIDGNMREPTMASEIWTFTSEYNGPWLLAEISD
jgi:predicted lipid-binding transport protein (Tim44 family)